MTRNDETNFFFRNDNFYIGTFFSIKIVIFQRKKGGWIFGFFRIKNRPDIPEIKRFVLRDIASELGIYNIIIFYTNRC